MPWKESRAGGPWGSGPKRAMGLRPAAGGGRGRPILKDLLRRAQDRLQQLLPGRVFQRPSAIANRAARGRSRSGRLSGFLPRFSPKSSASCLRFGKYVRDAPARVELSSAVSDRDRAAAEGAAGSRRSASA